MIKPTVGRVMWYWPDQEDRGADPLCALVAFVHNENLVNLAVFDENAQQFAALRVPIVQDGSPHVIGVSAYAEWMPYQKGQAAKAEQLEQKLAGS